MFEAWQLGMIDEAGYNGIRKEHIDEVARMMISSGAARFDRNTFDRCCYKCGIDPDNFTRDDIEQLKDKLGYEDSDEDWEEDWDEEE